MDTQIQSTNAANVVPNLGQRTTRPVEPRSPTSAEVAAERPKAEPTREEFATAAKKVQSFVEQRTSELQFSIDEGSGVQVVRVLDRSTKEVIRQIPSQEVLEIAQALEKLQGILLKQKA
jgi:flagellar protein FlaG